jgi:quinoprotein glucose dehydrogenase
MTDQDFATRKEGAPGVVRGFDVARHAAWTWNPIPQAGEPGVETWENGSEVYTGAANVWSSMSADEELGYVYLPTTSATSDYYGGHRLGDNLYSTSVVCLDVTTGKRVWHFQTVHHDIFDYDNPAAPILADLNVAGRRIKAVVQVTKQAFAYVFDRVTGRPVWPIEEAPRSCIDVAGREGVAHAAVSDEAAGLRSAGDHRGRSDRLHAGTARRGARDRQEVRPGPDVHAGFATRAGARRQAGHDSNAWNRRWGRLDWGRLRS